LAYAGGRVEFGETLAQAEAAYLKHDDVGHVNHLAYLTSQRVALANEAAARKGAEATVAQLAVSAHQNVIANKGKIPLIQVK